MSETKADQSAWLGRTFGVTFSGAEASDRDERVAWAQAGWAAARTTALASLKQLEAAIRALKDPQSDPAIILVRAIMANLTEVPSTKAAVGELRRYLESDPIIGDAEMPNGFGVKVRLRAPLCARLDDLDSALPA